MRRARLFLALLAGIPGIASGGATRDKVVIANWTRVPIREIYLSPGSAQDWGPDRLEGRTVLPGDDARLLYGGGCAADLRVVFANDAAEERHDLDVCSAPFVGVQPGWTTAEDTALPSPPALITVRNRSGRPVERLYLFAADADAEGADRLGHEMLPDGAETNLLRPRAPTCDYSLRAVFEGGQLEERHDHVDLCRYSGIVIEPQ
jgi:hypothetical protein